jgi:sulfonate dioxygenase
MAPGLIDPAFKPTETTPVVTPKQVTKPANTHNYVPGRTTVQQHDDTYEYEHLRPRFPDITWPALGEIPYSDKGLLGDANYKDLLASATDVFDYNPKIGTEIHGVDLANLTDPQKNDLARLIATRGVVFFRAQHNFGIEEQRALGQYFGTLHKHATTAVPRQEGLEDVHVVYTGENSPDLRALFTPTFLWHSDVTYEVQPPSYTSLKVLSGPPRGGGGDTLWSSQYAAYDMLSPAMQTYLESLSAVHSADLQAQGTEALGRTVRRAPVNTIHPLIRTNPVTGWKSLFFNPGFVTKILGIPKTTSSRCSTRSSPRRQSTTPASAGRPATSRSGITASRITRPRTGSRRIGDMPCVLPRRRRGRIWIRRVNRRRKISQKSGGFRGRVRTGVGL